VVARGVTVVGGTAEVAVVVPVAGGDGAGCSGTASPPVAGVVGVVVAGGAVVGVVGAVVTVVVVDVDVVGSGSCAPDGAAATQMAPAANATATAPRLDRRAVRRMVCPRCPVPRGAGTTLAVRHSPKWLRSLP
jgi:hypothetical protein